MSSNTLAVWLFTCILEQMTEWVCCVVGDCRFYIAEVVVALEYLHCQGKLCPSFLYLSLYIKYQFK